MSTEKLLPRHPFREGSSSPKTNRTALRRARLREIGLEEPRGSEAELSGVEIISPECHEELTDLTVIERFVQGSGLSDNLNLKIEAINCTNYLTTYDGITIASINLADIIPFALAKRESSYWPLVNQSLLKHHYMPLSQTWQQEFIRYKRQELPDGYALNFTQAGYLHQTWLKQQQSLLTLDLLLFVRNSWYPIRAIAEDQGTLAIQTLVAETRIQAADWLIWLSTPEDQAILQAIAQSAVLEEIGEIVPRESPGAIASHPAIQPAGQELDHPLPQELMASEPGEAVKVQPGSKPPQTILTFQDGRLHIATVAGEVVVEGTDLRFWICPDR